MRKRLQQVIALWPILIALLSGAGSTYAWIFFQIDQHIHEAVRFHDRETVKDAHPSHQARLKALENYWDAHLEEHNRIYGRLSKAEKEMYELYWFAVGDKAAELEPDRRKRNWAATQARERFRIYIRDGEGLKDAYRHALESSLPR